MQEQELLILGLLKEGPKHGYQIKHIIKEVIQTFTYLDAESIYYPLKIMERAGFITKEIGRSGKRPQKYIYHLSPKGELRFKELLNKNFLSINRPFFNIDLSLYFLSYVSNKVAWRRLSARVKLLNRIKSGLGKTTAKLIQARTVPNLLAILRHNLELVEAEIKFTEGLINTFNKK